MSAQDRLPPIPLDKLTEVQRQAIAEFTERRGTGLFGPFHALRAVTRSEPAAPALPTRFAIVLPAAQSLANSFNARAPFLSPDGRWIGFFDQRGDVKNVSINGGSPVAVCRVTGTSRRASWGPDDMIVFATSDRSSGLLRVPAHGGEPTVQTTVDPASGEEDHYFPSVLPSGRGVLFTIAKSDANPTWRSSI